MSYAINQRRLPAYVIAGFALAWLAAGASAKEFKDDFGTWDVTTDKNKITIKFTPNKDKVKCKKIVFVQTIRDFADDKATVPPSKFNPKWAFQDDDALEDGTLVDHVFCEKDPYYNGDDPQDNYTQGSSDGTTVKTAEIVDEVKLNFFGEQKKRSADFETCAVCAETGENYGCIRWKYERTKGAAGFGTVTIVSAGPKPDAASQKFKDALKKFVENHTGSFGIPICPELEQIPAGDCANRVYNRKGPLVFHVDDKYKVESVDQPADPKAPDKDKVRKGHGDPKKGVPNCGTVVKAGDKLVACDFVLVPKDRKICIKREKSPAEPLTATFADLFMGSCETVETGVCAAEAHCGTYVWSCRTGNMLTSVVPVDTEDSETMVMYTAQVDDVSDIVTVTNDPLSSHLIIADDLLDDQPGLELMPGETQTFYYPGLIGECFTPDQLHLYGPVPGKLPVGAKGQVVATVEADFVPLFDREVVFTRLMGDFSFVSGDVSPDGTQTKMKTTPDGQAAAAFVAKGTGPALMQVTVPDGGLSAFSFFEIVPPARPAATGPPATEEVGDAEPKR